MNQERPFLQIPAPSESDYLRLYEEWLKRKKREEEETKGDKAVIVTDI